MDIDAENLFRDDDEDPENEFYEEKEATKEFVVYLVDAAPSMFVPFRDENGTNITHFQVALNCISMSLKTLIVNRDYDEVAVCFFNTREKKNLQDLGGVFVFNVLERDDLDRPTARLINELSHINESFMKSIGSRSGIVSGARENPLYNAIWVAQALLRKGSVKNVDKRILLFTNEDDPFGCLQGAIKSDMKRTTLQRAKDAQDLGISIELLPMNRPGEEFNVSKFYAELLGLEDDQIAEFMPSAVEKLEDMTDQLRRRIYKKRKVRRIRFIIANGVSIELNTYALIRPAIPGTITWLDSVTSLPLKSERSFICADTGALLVEPMQRFFPYKNENIKFTVDELSEVKRLSAPVLRLLGFKPLDCLKDYHNLRPSTFLYPNDEEIIGSTCVFVALHRAMIRLGRYAVAFYGNLSHPQLVALLAQNEVTSPGGQVEPPGMHMIYLPFSDDIRHVEELQMDDEDNIPHATDDQVKSATSLLKRVDLRDFSVCQFANPALQRHYAILQALALGEDEELPDVKDETMPDEEGMSKPGIVSALDAFKVSVYGENHDLEEATAGKSSTSEASKKRKAIAETAAKESSNYDWPVLADSGKLKDLTVSELKYYLTAHNLPVAGKKEALVSRILTHLGK
ncbi:ATP-dependent DNA helicase 2 subunit KU70 isoform X2 [Nymphaea colorata]|uniref:ATP-dependent DNA helicase 2 subunit KU70 isoform X2 n=1 Tax=Nymphaea colorata TaxID=210225 RepID=UPI00129DDD60|nr:ATP-dependent DNA helicase 2 subunit KU70 isoform X2 [Nymphaea colorata]